MCRGDMTMQDQIGFWARGEDGGNHSLQACVYSFVCLIREGGNCLMPLFEGNFYKHFLTLV